MFPGTRACAMLSMLFACPGFAFRAGPAPHGSVRPSVRTAPPGAVRAASQPRCSPKMEISESDQKEITDMMLEFMNTERF